MNRTVAELYEQDFYAWLMNNVRLIRDGRMSEIDAENVAEELESMGKKEKRELINRLAVLMAHLLKWVYEPERRSHSWEYTIEEQRQRVSEVLEDSPSLKHKIEEKFVQAYQRAVIIAAKDTGLKKSYFPSVCPFSLEEVLDEHFYPES